MPHHFCKMIAYVNKCVQKGAKQIINKANTFPSSKQLKHHIEKNTSEDHINEIPNLGKWSPIQSS
jgi:hypothetical protein